MSFMIETSARHIHLTQETLEKLFGEGYELTVRKPLSYPGQFASNERLTVVGPKKEMANVSILGPVRKKDQIELSATDARTLGIDAPVRESGDVKGSGACKLVGPKGEVELTEGVIIAKRHLHITEADAAEMGVKVTELSKGIEKLQDQGYVRWLTDREAGRTYVELTSKAVELMAEERDFMKRCYARLRTELGDEELRRTVDTLQHMRDILKDERERGA